MCEERVLVGPASGEKGSKGGPCMIPFSSDMMRGASLPSGVAWGSILYEKSFNLKTLSQGDFGHFRENNQIILSKVATLP